MTDYAGGALQVGVPLLVVALASHFYLGPRRFRLGSAHSERAFPKRSVLAGCAWAIVFIRCFMLEPTKKSGPTSRRHACALGRWFYAQGFRRRCGGHVLGRQPGDHNHAPACFRGAAPVACQSPQQANRRSQVAMHRFFSGPPAPNRWAHGSAGRHSGLLGGKPRR